MMENPELIYHRQTSRNALNWTVGRGKICTDAQHFKYVQIYENERSSVLGCPRLSLDRLWTQLSPAPSINEIGPEISDRNSRSRGYGSLPTFRKNIQILNQASILSPLSTFYLLIMF